VFDGRFRSIVDKRVGPIGSALGRTGLSPDHLTALGLLLAVPAALAIGSGRLGLGLILLIASAIPDLLDGALAKAKGTASKRGAFFDSVSDRVTDALILGGVAWYLQSSRHGHASLLPFGVLAVSLLISYERAKAESLGFTAKGGLMERAERIILLCVGLVASVILVPILWAMLVLTALTAVQRFAKVWRQASAPSALPPAVAADRSPGSTSTRPSVNGASASDGGAGGASANGAGGHTPSVDANAAMAERWRAWRQQTGRDGASPRWEDRRAARLRANSEAKSARRASGGRQHGTRRP
jgi:CDP-diacylglycerol---glycerol-3-phosphate 3-phosphatidyltransferase